MQCESILHHLDSVIEWIEEGIDPAGICQELHFCPTPKTVNLKFKDNCTVCKAVLHLAKQDVPEAEMHAAVELTCKLLGEKYKSQVTNELLHSYKVQWLQKLQCTIRIVTKDS